jgi:hypothetical protein
MPGTFAVRSRGTVMQQQGEQMLMKAVEYIRTETVADRQDRGWMHTDLIEDCTSPDQR